MLITMVDATRATPGYAFINFGAPEECVDCSLVGVCIGNLEPGRKYRISTLREKEHRCRVFGKVRVVEVEEEAVAGAVSKSQAYLGAKIEYEPLACGKIFCRNYKYCVPEGLMKGDNCRVEEVIEDLKCEKGFSLQLVTLRRQ